MSLKEPVPARPVIKAMLTGLTERIYPNKFFTLTLKDLKATGLQGAKLSGWRFMGNMGSGDVSIHVDCGWRGKRPAMTEHSYGPHISSARDAIRKIVKSRRVKQHHYELRLLAIPELQVETVWLKAEADRPDLLVPYLPGAGLKAMQFYSMEKFLKVLKPEAEKGRFDDSPRMGRR